MALWELRRYWAQRAHLRKEDIQISSVSDASITYIGSLLDSDEIEDA
jgi:hypothetical protein